MLGMQHPLSIFQAALPPLLSAMLPSAATTSPTSPSADVDPPSALPVCADPPSEKKRNKQSTRSVSDTLQWRSQVVQTEPVNVIIITSSACYFVDTFFVPDERADTDKYGDSFGKAFVQWWDIFFIPYEGKDAPPLRDDVSAIVTDNVNYNVGAFKRHWKPRFAKAHHIQCLAHILNLVGMHFSGA